MELLNTRPPVSGGDTPKAPNIWEIAKRNNAKPRQVRIKKVDSYQRVGIL